MVHLYLTLCHFYSSSFLILLRKSIDVTQRIRRVCNIIISANNMIIDQAKNVQYQRLGSKNIEQNNDQSLRYQAFGTLISH